MTNLEEDWGLTTLMNQNTLEEASEEKVDATIDITKEDAIDTHEVKLYVNHPFKLE